MVYSSKPLILTGGKFFVLDYTKMIGVILINNVYLSFESSNYLNKYLCYQFLDNKSSIFIFYSITNYWRRKLNVIWVKNKEGTLDILDLYIYLTIA